MEEVRFVEKNGKTRSGVKLNCKICNKEFITRKVRSKGRQSKCCSKECGNISRRNRIELQCAWCKTKFSKSESKTKKSKSKLYFCTRKCKDEAQKLGGIKEIMPSHFGTAKVPEYRSDFSKQELTCSRCGYNEFDCCVDIHHIDENRGNNNKINLIPLCSCCHRGLHFGRWNLSECLEQS